MKKTVLFDTGGQHENQVEFDKLDLKKTKHVLLNLDSKQKVHHLDSGLVLGLIKHRFKMIKRIV